MSNWTHVTGVIRFDTVSEQLWENKKLEAAINGLIWGSEKENTMFPLPTGSEGSIDWDYVPVDNKYSITKAVLVITGDLRDFDDPGLVTGWVRSLFTTSNLPSGSWVRDGVVSVCEDHYNKQSVIRWSSDKEEWVELTIPAILDN